MTLLYRDPLFLEHDTGLHPECAARLRAVTDKLTETGLIDRCTPGRYQPLSPDDLTLCHPKEMIERARTVAEAGGGRLDPDTVVSPASFKVALAAAGACTAAAAAVVKGEDKTALALVRPPGHHATDRRSMGFCLFNSVALATRLVQKRHGVGRVLIVDWDVHHGNGTQDIF